MKAWRIKLLFLITTSLLIFQSCSIVSMSHSELRVPNQEPISLSPDCSISSTGAIYMNFAGVMKGDFLPASIKVVYKSKLIYIDPVVVDDTLKADYILITHNHADHFSIPGIKKLSGDKTTIIGPEPVTKKLKEYNTKTLGIEDSLYPGDIQVKTIAAYNLKKNFFSIRPHKYSEGKLGYIITCGSVKIYHAGDTDFIPEMKELKDIDIAIVPIGTGNTAMNPQQAAEAVNTIKPRITTPIHYDLGQGNEQTFKELVNEDIDVRFLHPIH